MPSGDGQVEGLSLDTLSFILNIGDVQLDWRDVTTTDYLVDHE